MPNQETKKLESDTTEYIKDLMKRITRHVSSNDMLCAELHLMRALLIIETTPEIQNETQRNTLCRAIDDIYYKIDQIR